MSKQRIDPSAYASNAKPLRPPGGTGSKCLLTNGLASRSSSISASGGVSQHKQPQQNTQQSRPNDFFANQQLSDVHGGDTVFDEFCGVGGENAINGHVLNLGGAPDENSMFGGDGNSQMFMMQGGQGQGQGQGFQSQNASSIMHHNPSLNDFGFADEPSGIEAGDRISSDGTSHLMRLGGGQSAAPGGGGGTRTNESQVTKVDPLVEAQTLKTILTQLQAAIPPSQRTSQAQTLLTMALKHQTSLQDALIAEKQGQSEWRQAFKEKVRTKLKAFKSQKKQELQKAEEVKFKQQINEFELHERVSSLEQAYSHQQEEINKQANANEILKFEKIKLIQQQSKRLTKIETALTKIQIQKSSSQQQNQSGKKDEKQPKSTHHVRGHSTAIYQTHQSPSNFELQRRQERRAPPDSQSNKQRKADELSKSFCLNDQLRASGLDSFEGDNNNSLLLKMQQSKGSGSTSAQLDNLQTMIKQFKQHSDMQRQKEVQQNEFVAPLNSMEQGKTVNNNDPDDQLSLSDIDFDPKQKLMNNFFTSQKEDVVVEENKSQQPDAAASSGGDVNQAVIMGDSQASGDPDTAVQSFCGDLAEQLNNTSFFAGNNKDIYLPDNLNFFSCGDENNFQSPQKSQAQEEAAVKQSQKDEIRQLEEDMACLTDQDMSHRFKAAGSKQKVSQQDSDDKEVEDLFKDSSDSIQLHDQSKVMKTPTVAGKKTKAGDVNFDDLMQASVATELKQQPEVNNKRNGFSGEELDDNFLDDVDAAFLDKDDSLSPVLKDDGGKNKLDFMQSNILNFDDVNVEEKPAQNGDISLALPDLSAIGGDHSSDDDNLADLNRKLMPNFVVNVGEKQIKMPKLDIQRVVQLEDRKTFQGNLQTPQTESLQTDTILDTHKDMKDVDNSGSFLNETGSKQVQSECQLETLKSKQKESESDANLLEYLNKCDHAISAIIEDAPFDGKDDIQVCDNFKKNTLKFENTQPKEEVNFLDSLREEILKEDNEKLGKEQPHNSASGNGGQSHNKLVKSPTTNSMPFELKDSFKSKLTDSNKQQNVMKASAITYKNKQSLLTVASKARQSCASVEKEEFDRAQLRSIHKTDLTMSQKEFDKKSQMMRLSELDTGSNHMHNSSQKNEATRVTKMGVMQMSKKIIDEVHMGRQRAPSENQAFERNKDSAENVCKLLSVDSLTNGTDSIIGSLQTHSAFGDKSRASAPVTFTMGTKQQQQRMPPRDSAYTTEVVNEVDDEDSKILSANNSNSKLVDESCQDQSIQMLAYNSAYPHTTKNIRQQTKNHHNSVKGGTSSSNTNQNPQNQQLAKKTKVSIQMVQHHAEMSSLIKNQQKSSSIQKLKIVKKVSVSSAAAAPSGGQSDNGGIKRDVLSSNSVERPSIGANSSLSLIEQSRIARVNASSVNHDYSTVQGEQIIKESSNPRLSINTRKTKPITVSFKNIVKTSIQKRKASNAAASVVSTGQDSSILVDHPGDRRRDDSEKNGSVISMQRVVRNPTPVAHSQGKAGKISLSSKGTDGKSLNITVMRNSQTRQSNNRDENLVKHMLKVGGNANTSVEETRDGSIIFLGKRKTTVERVKPKRNQSNEVKPSGEEPPKGARPSSKSKTKVLISANQIKQRKLSIGSSTAAAAILQQNLVESGNTVQGGNGSRVQAIPSKVISPSSPRRPSSKSGVKILNQKDHHRDDDQNTQGGKRDTSKPGSRTVKKGSIIALKRRDAPVTEGSQHISSSKCLGGVLNGERVPSVGPDGNQSSKRSANTTEAPNLKIKRMTKSKNNSSSRPGSTRPNTVIRQQTSQYNTSSAVNKTTMFHEHQVHHDSLMIREMQTNQSNTILGDLSLLSKFGGGGGADSKGQMMVMPNLNYGNSSQGKPMGNQSVLINQSSQQNLPSQIYDGHSSFQLANNSGNCAKSAAGGKRVGLSRGSIEPAHTHHNVNQSQVATASNFMPANGGSMVNKESATGQQLQISQKAMKIISTQKSKHSGAQKQVQMEWKTSGMVHSSSSLGRHRNSAAPTPDPALL